MDLIDGAIPPRPLLIVGDPALSRGLMKMVLSRLGYVVTCVVSGRDCLMTVAHTRFALALIALSLPDTSGLNLARRLRSTPGALGAMPVILFGDAWDAERIRACCRESGIAAYLPKPISIGRLVSSIHDHLHRSSASSGATVAMPRIPSLDLERLSGFTNGDRQLEQELTTLYLSTAADCLDEMRRCLASRGGDWSRPAHALKGASANIGAVEMADIAAAAEHAIPSAESLRHLETGLEAVRSFVDRRLARATGDGRLRRTG